MIGSNASMVSAIASAKMSIVFLPVTARAGAAAGRLAGLRQARSRHPRDYPGPGRLRARSDPYSAADVGKITGSVSQSAPRRGAGHVMPA
jgi:hypothetical protein